MGCSWWVVRGWTGWVSGWTRWAYGESHTLGRAHCFEPAINDTPENDNASPTDNRAFFCSQSPAVPRQSHRDTPGAPCTSSSLKSLRWIGSRSEGIYAAMLCRTTSTCSLRQQWPGIVEGRSVGWHGMARWRDSRPAQSEEPADTQYGRICPATKPSAPALAHFRPDLGRAEALMKAPR